MSVIDNQFQTEVRPNLFGEWNTFMSIQKHVISLFIYDHTLPRIHYMNE